MARLSANDLSANADVTVYTVPANRRALFTVSLCNRNNHEINVRIALTSGTLTNADYIEYQTPVPAYGVLERSGIILTGGQAVVVRSTATNLSVVTFGIEEQV